jgi:hypothetical protein
MLWSFSGSRSILVGKVFVLLLTLWTRIGLLLHFLPVWHIDQSHSSSVWIPGFFSLGMSVVYLFSSVSVMGRSISLTSGLVYYESMKRELKTRPIYECRCDERLKTKAEESTWLTYTGLVGELDHLKIETRLIDEMFASVMGEYAFVKW